MANEVNEPKVFVHRYGVEAIKVARPFKSVTEWCPAAKMVKDGPKFSHFVVENNGQQYIAKEGVYIVKVFPDREEYVVYPAALFQQMFKLAKGQKP